MSDEQLKRKATIRRILIASGLMLLISAGLWYFRYTTTMDYELYQREMADETSVQSQVDALNASNGELLARIEENGKQLVSFKEDKIKYINLASQLSNKYSVEIDKLTVSDVWTEGEMSGMTTSIEVLGSLANIRKFVEDYCGSEYVNRINVVSCRDVGRYSWLDRVIDEQQVLPWLDLSDDKSMAAEQERVRMTQGTTAEVGTNEFGMPVVDLIGTGLTYSYDAETGKFIWDGTSVEVDQDTLDETPITVEKIFADGLMKAYLVIDFLGRE